PDYSAAAQPDGGCAAGSPPIAGLYDPESGQAGAIDVALFILIIGGFLGIVTKTGAIDAGIERVTTRLRAMRQRLNIDDDTFVFGSIGSLIPRKAN
ncbi:hypothetical protein ABKU38_21930, partial [Enterobacter hormaechei]